MKDITDKDKKNNLKLSSKNNPQHKSNFLIGDCYVGRDLLSIAGPCRVESYEQVYRIASFLNDLGVKFFRAGAFKPCTFPYASTGLKEDGLEILKEVKNDLGMQVITEVMDIRDIKKIEPATDIFQIGARNMQNYNLLAEVAQLGMPVMLKRHPGATLRDFLGDYVPSIAQAAVAAGADGTIVEVHYDPPNSVSDPLQALDYDTYTKLYTNMVKIRNTIKW